MCDVLYIYDGKNGHMRPFKKVFRGVGDVRFWCRRAIFREELQAMNPKRIVVLEGFTLEDSTLRLLASYGAPVSSLSIRGEISPYPLPKIPSSPHAPHLKAKGRR